MGSRDVWGQWISSPKLHPACGFSPGCGKRRRRTLTPSATRRSVYVREECACVCSWSTKKVWVLHVWLLSLTLWLMAESALLPPSPTAEEAWKLLREAGLRVNHPSKEPRARPSSLLTRNRSSQDVWSSWIISTGAPSSVMVVRVSGMSSLSW